MKNRLFSVLIAFVLGITTLSFGLFASACNPPKKPISILAIGSSYLRNSMDHVYPILEDLGYDQIILGNIYSSGCKIEKHMENIDNNSIFIKSFM